MSFPLTRPRRLRKTNNIRNMFAESSLSVNDLMYPIFVVHGKNIKKEINGMPGQYHWSIDNLEHLIDEISLLKIPSVMIFGVPKSKDDLSSENYNDEGIVQQAVRKIKSISNDIVVATDVCMCGYTNHGHCGIVDDSGYVDNDKTLDILAKTAVSHVKAGADIVAPSGMMDGMILAMRSALDNAGYTSTSIMSYSVKYASAFYGPFRSACDSSLTGDRKTYQMDYRNLKESIIEANEDIEQGADVIMVKPAMSYLDVVHNLSSKINIPIAAYHVSGEYSMVKLAALNSLVDEKDITLEVLTSMKRAGASLILTYSALDVAKWLSE